MWFYSYTVSHIVSTVDGSINDDGEIIIRVSKTSVIAHEVILATVVTPNAKTAKRLSSGEALVYLSQSKSTCLSGLRNRQVTCSHSRP